MTQDSSEKSPPAGQDATKDRILDAAVQLFSSHGYQATSLSRIAARVGVSAPALYWHFDSKKELLYSVIKRRLMRFNEKMSVARDSEREPYYRLIALATAHILAQLQAPTDVAVYSRLYAPGALMSALSELSEEAFEELRELEAQTFHLLRDTITEGRASGVFHLESPTITTFAIISVAEDAPTWFRPDGRLSQDEVTNKLVRIILEMVGARTPLNIQQH